MRTGRFRRRERHVARYAWPAGVGVTSDTFTGTLAEVNAALSSVVFTPAAGGTGIARLVLEIDERSGPLLRGQVAEEFDRPAVVGQHASNQTRDDHVIEHDVIASGREHDERVRHAMRSRQPPQELAERSRRDRPGVKNVRKVLNIFIISGSPSHFPASPPPDAGGRVR